MTCYIAGADKHILMHITLKAELNYKYMREYCKRCMSWLNLTVIKVKQAAIKGQTEFVRERGNLQGCFRCDVGFTINSAGSFSVMPLSVSSAAGSALVCLCTDLPVMLFLNTEKRNDTGAAYPNCNTHSHSLDMSINIVPVHTSAAL